MPEGWGAVDPTSFAVVATVAIAAGLLAAALRPSAIVRRPWIVLALLAVVTAGAGASLLRLDPVGIALTIDPSTEPLLPTGDPGVAIYRNAVRDFGGDQLFVIAMECDDVFRFENLTALRRAGDAISRIDGVRSVKSLMRVTSFRYVPEEDWVEVRPFIEDVPEDPAALAVLRVRALDDPIYRRNLVSEDGRAAALNVFFKPMSDRAFVQAEVDGQIRAILDSETTPGRRFFVSGRPHVKAHMYRIVTHDLLVLIPTAIGLIGVVLALVVGTVRGVVLPLANVCLAAFWTFGSIAFLELPLTVLTGLLAPTLVAIGSVYGVHVVNRFEEEAADAGGAAPEVALRTLRAMRLPVVIAGVTTVVGFAALLLTDVRAVFEIGAFSILGVASVTLSSLTGVPAVLALLPVPQGGRRERIGLARRMGGGLAALLATLACVSVARPRALMLFWAAITLIAVALIPRIVIDTDYLSFFDADDPVRRDFAAINRLLSGAVPLFVVLSADEPGAFREPELLERVAAMQQRIDALPGVSRSLSFLEPLRLLNRAIEGGDPAEERLPDTRGAVSELVFMLPKPDLMRFATIDHSAMNLMVRSGEVGSAAVRRLTASIEAILAEARLPAGIRADVTGNAVLLSRAADGVAEGQPRTVGLAALTIFALVSLGLRSVRLGLVAMVPNVVPVLIFFGALGAGAAPLSLPTSLIGAIAMGIAIDATAHYVIRYREERLAGRSPEDAVRSTTASVGRPVVIAATMLTVGFLSVALSEFATLRQFGMLTAFTMVVCALTDLTLLPALLVRSRL